MTSVSCGEELCENTEQVASSFSASSVSSASSSASSFTWSHQTTLHRSYWVHTLIWLGFLAQFAWHLAQRHHATHHTRNQLTPYNRLVRLRNYLLIPIALLECHYGVVGILLFRSNNRMVHLGIQQQHWILLWNGLQVGCVATCGTFVVFIARAWELSSDQLDCLARGWTWVFAWFYGFWFVVWEQSTTPDAVLFLGFAIAWGFVAFQIWFHCSKSIFRATRTIHSMQQQQQQQHPLGTNQALSGMITIKDFFVQYRRVVGGYLVCALVVATTKFSVFSNYKQYQWIYFIVNQCLHLGCSALLVALFHRFDLWRKLFLDGSLSSGASLVAVQPVAVPYPPDPMMLAAVQLPGSPASACAPGCSLSENSPGKKKKNNLVVVLNPQAGAAIAYGIPHRSDDQQDP